MVTYYARARPVPVQKTSAMYTLDFGTFEKDSPALERVVGAAPVPASLAHWEPCPPLVAAD